MGLFTKKKLTAEEKKVQKAGREKERRIAQAHVRWIQEREKGMAEALARTDPLIKELSPKFLVIKGKLVTALEAIKDGKFGDIEDGKFGKVLAGIEEELIVCIALMDKAKQEADLAYIDKKVVYVVRNKLPRILKEINKLPEKPQKSGAKYLLTEGIENLEKLISESVVAGLKIFAQ